MTATADVPSTSAAEDVLLRAADLGPDVGHFVPAAVGVEDEDHGEAVVELRPERQGPPRRHRWGEEKPRRRQRDQRRYLRYGQQVLRPLSFANAEDVDAGEDHDRAGGVDERGVAAFAQGEELVGVVGEDVGQAPIEPGRTTQNCAQAKRNPSQRPRALVR